MEFWVAKAVQIRISIFDDIVPDIFEQIHIRAAFKQKEHVNIRLCRIGVTYQFGPIGFDVMKIKRLIDRSDDKYGNFSHGPVTNVLPGTPGHPLATRSSLIILAVIANPAFNFPVKFAADEFQISGGKRGVLLWRKCHAFGVAKVFRLAKNVGVSEPDLKLASDFPDQIRMISDNFIIYETDVINALLESQQVHDFLGS